MKIRISLAALGAALVAVGCGDRREEEPAPAEAPAERTQPSGPLAAPEPAAPAAPAVPGTPGAPAAPSDLRIIMGDITPAASDGLLVEIPAELASRGGMYGHKDAVAAFARMHAAAKAEGVELRIISAFRSFQDQKRIWNNKWNGNTRVEGGKLTETIPDPAERARKILEYSSMPGTSRHHWGTDFDFNDLNNAYFETGDGKLVHDWLVANASSFGFCQVYSPKGPERPSGYEREDWHWSYTPVASAYLAQYPALVGYENLAGFDGAEAAAEIDVIGNYVQGIDPSCR